MKLRILAMLQPGQYNNPTSVQMLWNQWLHQGFLWGWYSYEFYADHQLDLPKKRESA